MSTEAKDPELAHKTARWVLLVPLSLVCGLGVGLATRAAVGLLPPQASPLLSLVGAWLSGALAAGACLSAARSVAPFWKAGVVVVFAAALVLVNVPAVFSPSWSLLKRRLPPNRRADLAENIGALSVASAVLVVALRRGQGRRAPT